MNGWITIQDILKELKTKSVLRKIKDCDSNIFPEWTDTDPTPTRSYEVSPIRNKIRIQVDYSREFWIVKLSHEA